MLRIDRSAQTLERLGTPSLSDVSITERYDLQEFIFNSPDDFFSEIGQSLFIIGKEFQPSDVVQDRIDLLALDPEGNTVIIELKRGNHKFQLLQAVSYAGMIAKWKPDDILQTLSAAQAELLLDFLEVDRDDINRRQRIILVAEAYDFEVLVGAEWLHEEFDVDIACCRIGLTLDEGSNLEYLVCSPVYPAPELSQQAVPRGKQSSESSNSIWRNWGEALAPIQNQALVSYVNSELNAGRENYLLKRILRYRVNGKRKFFVAARIRLAYVWQEGRFEGDQETWQAGLSEPEKVKPVKDGKCLRFFLKTEGDFAFFHETASTKLDDVEWLNHPPEQDEDLSEGDDDV